MSRPKRTSDESCPFPQRKFSLNPGKMMKYKNKKKEQDNVENLLFLLESTKSYSHIYEPLM